MRLSDFIVKPNSQNSTGTGKVTANPMKTEQLSQQLKTLAPGQTISGEVVSRNGNEVQIRLADDSVINAKLEQNMHLEVGKGMTFEVKNNGSTLTLSPLFANTATDATVLKALDMASLPINDTTIQMTQSMMEAGLSIDKNSLLQIFRELNTYPGATVENVVDLHRLGMTVNEENLQQIASYKNMTYQLTEGMNSILGELPGQIEALVQEGSLDKAAGMYQTLLDMIDFSVLSQEEAPGRVLQQSQLAVNDTLAQMTEGLINGTVGEAGLGAEVGGALAEENLPANPAGNPIAAEGVGANTAQTEQFSEALTVGKELAVLQGETELLNGLATSEQSAVALTQEESVQLAGELQKLLANLEMPEAQKTQLGVQLAAMEAGELSTADTLTLVRSLIQVAGEQSHLAGNALARILTNQSLSELVTQALKENWTLQPQNMKEPKELDELYGRLNKQLHTLAEGLEKAGLSNTNTVQNVAGMTRNLDFMQQLNQMYTFVQLPLKMGERSAHGDLYVYSNKKHLASKDGKISALLHLDMEHLGPVDVYVAMQGERVNTNFYVADEEMLDFLLSHIDILNNRLADRGYDMKCEMKVRQAENSSKRASTSVIDTILQETSQGNRLVQYAFDVRA